MGAIPDESGVTLTIFKADGKTASDLMPKPQLYPSCFITAQTAVPGIGSQDWLKEIYLADKSENLYKLLKTFPATGTHPPLTSLASQQVVINYVDPKGILRSKNFLSCVGYGKDAGGVTKVNAISVTQGDAHRDDTNGLYADFHQASLFLMLTPIELTIPGAKSREKK